MEEENIIRFTLRLPRELHDRISASADQNNRSVTAEMISLLTSGLTKTEEKEPEHGILEQLLPPNLLWRLKRYQERIGIKTPEDASKRLIRAALDEEESITDILDKLSEAYRREKDLRILAQDTVAGHSAITQIVYGDGYIWFSGKNHESGAISREGDLYYGTDGQPWGMMSRYEEIPF